MGVGRRAARAELGPLDPVGRQDVEGAFPSWSPGDLDVGLGGERQTVDQRGGGRRRIEVGGQRDLDLGQHRRVLEVEEDVAGVGQLDQAALR